MKTTLSTYELTKIFISTDNEIKTDTIIAYFPKVLKNDEKLRSQYATIINYLTLSDDIYKNNAALTTATKKLIATCCQADGITNEHLIQQSKFPMGKLRACVLAIAYDRALQHHEEIVNKEDEKNE